MMFPHNPLICERELFDYYMGRIDEASLPRPDDQATLHPAIRAWRQRRRADQIPPAQQRRGLAAYYGLVTQMDRNIGRIVEQVRRSSQAKDTIIIYTSDHGDMADEHGMWWKSCFYEGSARVPLIFSGPGCPRNSVDAVCSLIDVGPTVLELQGAPALPDADGRSLVPFLKGAAPKDWPDEAFCEYLGAHGDKPSCMVRRGPWKLSYYSEFDSYQLFNLVEDPGEVRDRAADPTCREIGAALLAELRSHWSAQAMVAGAALQHRSWQITDRCGHALIPHAVVHETPPPEANQFDFGQLPDWEQVRARAATGAK
jgi:choline-sulfatase